MTSWFRMSNFHQKLPRRSWVIPFLYNPTGFELVMMATLRCICEVPMIVLLMIFLIFLAPIINGFCRFYCYNFYLSNSSVFSSTTGLWLKFKVLWVLSRICKIVSPVSQSFSLEFGLPGQAPVSSSSEMTGLLPTICTLFTLLVDATGLVCVSPFTLWNQKVISDRQFNLIDRESEWVWVWVWVGMGSFEGSQISLDDFEVGYVNNVYFEKHSPKIFAEDKTDDFF